MSIATSAPPDVPPLLPPVVTSPLLAAAGLPHLFSTRHFAEIWPPGHADGPFGPDARAAIRARGLDADRIAFARQVHGAEVAAVQAGGRVGIADALVTDQPGLPLAVLTADCVPVVILDPGGDAAPPRVAAVHAGWRGTAQGVTRAAAEALVRAGGQPRRFIAAIGPSIGPCCYEVDRPVIERLDATHPRSWRSWVRPGSPGRWMLDLWRANRDQLVGAGLDAERIDGLELCTSCRLDLFFSYRRGAAGRLVTVVALPGAAGASC